MSRRTVIVVLLLTAVLATLNGCVGRAVREGYHGIVGAAGVPLVISGQETQIKSIPLTYGNYQLERFTCDIGTLCDPQFFSALPNRVSQELSTREVDDEDVSFFVGPSNRTVIIRGRVIHYETADLLGVAMGPMEEAICRVQLVDADSGTVLADTNCVGRVESTVRSGPDELAHGVARAIRELLMPEASE
ncbi:MAG: hypothetical protein JW936_05020 [Sedimentisphaerales bacterium]|nr:hypothetical protein [Sedimentisphaerales bacterium]